ncbi:MAG: hypothetical protein JXA60_05205 [Candidatus Coatesbacteria bacterium]|nr:hypothetical protein [Candidatus Coatesbacteria bacterium]
MRLWSISPEYLDTKGLTALWRESLLAQAVISGKTKAYRNHPQLARFMEYCEPLQAIGSYLVTIHEESIRRDFGFDFSKILHANELHDAIPVNDGQILYEYNHLLEKLRIRDFNKYQELKGIRNIKANLVFHIVKGDIENWERVHGNHNITR